MKIKDKFGGESINITKRNKDEVMLSISIALVYFCD